MDVEKFLRNEHDKYLPWQPKKGELVFYPGRNGDSTTFSPKLTDWQETTEMLALFRVGMIYRTYEECEEHLVEDCRFLTGKPMIRFVGAKEVGERL